MYRRTFVGSGAVAISMAVAGCTGNLGGGTNPDTAGGDAGEGDSESRTISISGTEFQPRQLRVPTGTRVRWTNEDSAVHTVSSTSFSAGGTDWSFSSEQLGNGDSASHTFGEPGAYEYFCTIHGDSTMCGVVIVGGTSYDETLPCEDGTEAGGGMY